jgi:hypothetical protein
MSARTRSVAVPLFFLLALIQLVGGFSGSGGGPAAAVLAGSGAAWILRRSGIGVESWWPAPLLAGASTLTGVALPMLSDTPRWSMLLFPVIAASAASLIALIRPASEPLCSGCNRRLRGGTFDCPRCGVTVCDQDCWNYQASRCRACEAGNVPILPPDAVWWERNLGRRIARGKCQHCLAGAETADLRACHECARTYCRDCWDANNGQCAHCAWVIRELPAALHRYVLRYDPPPSATRRVRPRTG